MLNGNQLINMERRNVVISVVQDRSKLQTYPPTVFKMSTPPQQATAEKSVQTQELNGSNTVLLTNNSLTHFHSENTAAEVANTLVSMASGSQGTTNVKQVNLISVPIPTSLPILSLADYTTSRGVPTAMALATQAKLSPVKHDETMDVSDENSSHNDSTSSVKSRSKSNRTKLMSKAAKKAAVEEIQYGPIVVKPRRTIAPTLANGRKSKDEPLPPGENVKRQQRRDRNRQAAAKCRKRRNDLREELEKIEKTLSEEQKTLELNVQTLTEQRKQLELLLQRHLCVKKTRFTLPTSSMKTDLKNVSTSSLFDTTNNNVNSKRVTINIANAQDLFTVSSLPRTNSTNESLTSNSSSGGPMITIHIPPEFAQAIFGSASVDKTRLADLLQQSSVTTMTNNESSSESIVAHPSDSIITHPNSNC